MADHYVHSLQGGRRKAYDEDLRWNAIFAIVADGDSIEDAARRCGVSSSTIMNWWRRFREAGGVSVRDRLHQRVERSLDDLTAMVLLNMLEHEPALYLSEMCRRLQDIAGFEVHPSTICRTLHQLKWSRKVMQTFALQRCSACRADFVTSVMMALPMRTFVWVDESGCQCSDCQRSRGWAPVGVRPTRFRSYRSQNNISCLTAVDVDGIVALKTTDGHVDGHEFYVFC